jgi:hypothetical protein
MKKRNSDNSQNKGSQIRYPLGCILFILIMCWVVYLPVLSESLTDNSILLPEFNVTPVLEPDQPITAIALTLQKTEKIPSPPVPLQSIQINLTDPDGIGQDVVLCGSLDFTREIKSGSPLYLVKRNKPAFFLVDNLTQGGCGGGTGGGGGSGGATNKALTPAGKWTVHITGDSNLTPFTGTFII